MTPKPKPSPLIEWRKLIVAAERLPASARLVALVLSTHMDRNGGSCFPSLTRLQGESGLARSTVCLALDRLDREGLISRVRGGRGRPTRYLATSPITGLPVVRSSDSTRPAVVPEDVQEDVYKPSGRADARRQRRGRAAGKPRPDVKRYDVPPANLAPEKAR